jgi:hypothetical protein
MLNKWRRKFSRTNTEHLTYKPLEGSEIRLLRVEKESSADGGEIFCQLKHVKLDSKPVYVALSYAWGDPNETKPIIVNGQRLDVTENLYAALLGIKSKSTWLWKGLKVPASKLLLWIDAICIDQGNVVEKSKQIPRMGSIFSSAYITLVWMNFMEQIDRHKFQLFVQTGASLAHWFKHSEGRSPSQIVRDLGRDREAVQDVHGYIIDNPWFSRLWTAQEYLLSARPAYAWFQSLLFPLWTVGAISHAFRKEDATTERFSGWIASDSLGELEETRTRIRSADHKALPLSNQIFYLLRSTIGRKCSLPHDLVYGILGMADLTKLPQSLIPNYALPFSKVYWDYTKYIVENTGSLSLLPCSENHLQGVPSWVPDLRYSISRQDSTPSTADSFSFSADGNELTIRGVEFARVLGRLERQDYMTRSCMREFVETILTAAAWIRRRPLEDIFVEWLKDVVQTPGSTTHLSNRWPTVESFIESFEAGLEYIGEGFRFDPLFIDLGIRVCSHYICLLDNGDIVHCNYPRALQDGNESVWLVKGCENPFVLTQTKKGYLFKGGIVSICGELLTLVFGEEIFSSRDVREIILI